MLWVMKKAIEKNYQKEKFFVSEIKNLLFRISFIYYVYK